MWELLGALVPLTLFSIYFISTYINNTSIKKTGIYKKGSSDDRKEISSFNYYINKILVDSNSKLISHLNKIIDDVEIEGLFYIQRDTSEIADILLKVLYDNKTELNEIKNAILLFKNENLNKLSQDQSLILAQKIKEKPLIIDSAEVLKKNLKSNIFYVNLKRNFLPIIFLNYLLEDIKKKNQEFKKDFVLLAEELKNYSFDLENILKTSDDSKALNTKVIPKIKTYINKFENEINYTKDFISCISSIIDFYSSSDLTEKQLKSLESKGAKK